jgi:hypothetical protein
VAAGALERVHLAMQRRTPELHAPVVAAADDPPLVHQRGADRDASFREAALRLLESRVEKHGRHSAIIPAFPRRLARPYSPSMEISA